MKSNIPPIASVLAGLAAAALIPVSATAATLAFTAAGILSILVADYSRNLAPLGAQAPVVPFRTPGRVAFGLARAA